MHVSSGMIYLIIVTTFLTIKLAALIGFPVDPFQPLEKVGSWLAFGGLWGTETVRTRNKKLEYCTAACLLVFYSSISVIILTLLKLLSVEHLNYIELLFLV